MLSTVSPVMVGADAASPQPTTPFSASIRTSILSACLISTPAMTTGFFMGKLTAIGSMRLIFTARSPWSFGLDDFGVAQFGDRFFVEPKLLEQDFVAVLAQHWRRATHRAGGVRKLEGNPEHSQGADGRML